MIFNHRGPSDHIIYSSFTRFLAYLRKTSGFLMDTLLFNSCEGTKVEASAYNTVSAKPRSCYHSGAEEWREVKASA